MWGIGLIRLSIGLLESPCECGIEPPCSISHGVSYDLSFPYVARRRKITWRQVLKKKVTLSSLQCSCHSCTGKKWCYHAWKLVKVLASRLQTARSWSTLSRIPVLLCCYDNKWTSTMKLATKVPIQIRPCDKCTTGRLRLPLLNNLLVDSSVN